MIHRLLSALFLPCLLSNHQATGTAKLVLHVRVYLDPNLTLLLNQSSAEETARQTIQQASEILQYDSLNTKIELVLDGKLQVSPYHLDPTREGLKKFTEFLQPPLHIDGSPVAHIAVTADVGKKLKNGVGQARQSSLCSPTDKPIVIVKWLKNEQQRTSTALAHEIGHLIGIYHDFRPVEGKRGSCGEGKYSGTFIMNYGQNPPREIWSDCSNQDFRSYFESVILRDGQFCLKEA
eukprot:GFUD01002422.1.p1 GENE.GFUD01002422.1~~GFUD01002422.1.p1  ORF type:complete len:235 (+),score=31.67 GFUD01002422.1:90-794(+)